MPIFLLQKPARKSTARDYSKCLQRRLKLWRVADLTELVREGRMIQQRLPKTFSPVNKEKLSRQFFNFMFQGKTKAALRLLTDKQRGKILHLDDPVDTGNGIRKVRDILVDKHPLSKSAHPDSIINVDPPDVHPIFLSPWMSQSSSLLHCTPLELLALLALMLLA